MQGLFLCLGGTGKTLPSLQAQQTLRSAVESTDFKLAKGVCPLLLKWVSYAGY